MKILLINPPSSAPNPVLPMGLAFIAAALRRADFAVEIIDAWAQRLSFEGLGRLIASGGHDIIGVTIMSPLYEAGMRTVDVAREHSRASIVVGGPHASAAPRECLAENKNIDFVVVGEGERVFAELARRLREGTRDFEGLHGVGFRRGDEIVLQGAAERIRDLDSLDFPSLDLFPLGQYRTHPPYGIRKRYMTMITSRGCPYGCTYCTKSVFGNEYRGMSPGRVYAWAQMLVDTYGADEIHFYDDDFTMDMGRAEAICDIFIEKKLRVAWSCTTRVDLVNEPLLKKMKKAGCWLISYGIESADPGILRAIHKGYGIEDVKRAFALTKRCGIKTVGFFMAGLPGETRRTLESTIAFSLSLNPDFVSWGITALYPGSRLYRECAAGAGSCIRGSAHASGSPYGDGAAMYYRGELTDSELKDAVKRANRRFYLRLPYLVSFVRGMKSAHQLGHYLKGGARTMLWSKR